MSQDHTSMIHMQGQTVELQCYSKIMPAATHVYIKS